MLAGDRADVGPECRVDDDLLVGRHFVEERVVAGIDNVDLLRDQAVVGHGAVGARFDEITDLAGVVVEERRTRTVGIIEPRRSR